MHRPEHMMRAQITTTVGTSAIQIAGPNPRRWGLLIDSPPIVPDPGAAQTKLVSAASTATTGVKQSFVVPAGQQAVLTSAGTVETTGTGVVSSLQIVRAATTFNLAQVTTTGVLTTTIPLLAGDTIQWNVTTAIAAAVNDYWLGIALDVGTSRVTISFLEGVTLDNGLNLYPGTLPLVLLYPDYGDAIHEAVFAVAQAGSVPITVVDFFG